MPPGASNAGRTREGRQYLTAPVTAEERERAQRNAARRGMSLAEYVRRRSCGDSPRDRMIAAPYIVLELRALLDEVPRTGPAREHLETLIAALE